MSTGDGARIDQRIYELPDSALRPPDLVDAPPGVHNLPAPDSRVFEGREGALAELAGVAPPGGGPAARTLYGQAGVGKSTLALRYAHAHLEEHSLTWWIAAADITAGLAALTHRLNPASAVPVGAEQAAQWAVSWLQGHHGWLLVFDNVEDVDGLRLLLGQLTTGRILLTTRRDLGPHAPSEPLHLDVLDRAVSVRVLSGITGRQDAAELDAAGSLAAELGDLPLALQQAGAYIVQTRSTIAGYLERLNRDPARMYDSAPEGGDPARTIARVWRHTLAAIEQRNPHAGFFLRMLAHFGPDDLPRHVLTPAMKEPADVDEMLALLAGYSLVDLTDTTVGMHRLLQAVLRGSPEPVPVVIAAPGESSVGGRWWRPRRRRRAAGVRVHLVPEAMVAGSLLEQAQAGLDTHDPSDWPAWRALVPHAEALMAHCSPEHHYVHRELVFRMGGYLALHGLDARALPFAEASLEAAEAVLGPRHLDLVGPLNSLAIVCRNLGRYDRADQLISRALKIAEAADDVEQLAALGNLATTYRSLGRSEEALPLAEKVLEISRRMSGRKGLLVQSVCLSNLATTYQALGMSEKSLELAEQALDLSRRISGKAAHPTTLTNLNNLAIAYRGMERHEDAARVLRQCLEIGEEIFEPDHPTVSITLSNLATVLRDLGGIEEALPLARRAAEASARTAGADHPTTLINLHNLAVMHLSAGNDEEAVRVALGALRASAARFGPDHRMTRKLLSFFVDATAAAEADRGQGGGRPDTGPAPD
ncbi:tetratricopeptide repeat protein [Kitasatospora sp. NPDC050463]|uniref:tetratricopeptide repeat protein n=1 Tax=Kitasatospora sp. NPDC050463 TaxID=3155786 RepID=UPI0033DBB99B